MEKLLKEELQKTSRETGLAGGGRFCFQSFVCLTFSSNKWLQIVTWQQHGWWRRQKGEKKAAGNFEATEKTKGEQRQKLQVQLYYLDLGSSTAQKGEALGKLNASQLPGAFRVLHTYPAAPIHTSISSAHSKTRSWLG